ncbi:BPTI/Kunitz domain-containing protein [Clupea harengus]|uniref:BPTI/Kunitz domain-containing protein n=1 Tax=Clupea harengus TaxID=7950 RepID=A0A6P8F6N7_CLUHA|nr:BPTI/Kunitz domain-containing protein [Clupea harengus]
MIPQSPSSRLKHDITMRQLGTFLVIFSAFYSIQVQSAGGLHEFCSLAPDEGQSTGDSFMIYLHYDTVQDKCQPFKYFGSGGNGNRFMSEKDCMRNCSANAINVYPVSERDACHLPKASGECLGSYLRYHYDSVHHKCKKFLWTGCAGNGNRFLDFQACNSTCYGETDPGEDPEEEEPDTPVALILGVVFGLIGAAILVVVIVLAVKTKPSGKKAQKSPKGTDTAAPLRDEGIEMS